MASSAALAPVFEHIEANRPAFLDRLIDYLRHPSISAENIGIAEVGNLLLRMLGDIGLQASLIPTEGHPMVIGRWEKAPGKPTVLLYGHYDVQPADPLDKWLSPPFEPTIRDGRLYARGVGDNKGQHFAQILAIESHLKVHGELPCNVILLLEGEEEIGSPRIAGFVRAHSHLLKADLAVTADGPRHASGAPTIKFGSRGVVSFDLRCRHASRDVHSGNFGGVVPNPIWTLVHLLATMKNADGEITIEGLHDDVLPPTAEDIEAIARLPLDLDAFKQGLGLSRLDAPLERPFYDRLCFQPTLTINGFHGGYGGPGTKTVLPNEALVKCDIRLVEAQDPQDVLLIFSVTGRPRSLVDGAEIATSLGASVIAVTDPSSPLAARASVVVPLIAFDEEKFFYMPNRGRYGQLFVLDCLATLVGAWRRNTVGKKLWRARSNLVSLHGTTDSQPVGD